MVITLSSNDPPGSRYWALISPVWIPLNEAWDRGVSEYLERSQSVPSYVLNLYAAHWCQSEVNNGGFYQFFFNTTGLLAPEAAAGFNAIGLLAWSAILGEAMDYFGDRYPRERTVRVNQLPKSTGERRKTWDPFTALDDRFYACANGSRGMWEKAADAYAASAV